MREALTIAKFEPDVYEIVRTFRPVGEKPQGRRPRQRGSGPVPDWLKIIDPGPGLAHTTGDVS
jgi:hypothetical protein